MVFCPARLCGRRGGRRVQDDFAKEVAEAYFATLALDRNDRLAFTIALGVYFKRHPGISDDAARDAVTLIIAEAAQGPKRPR